MHEERVSPKDLVFLDDLRPKEDPKWNDLAMKAYGGGLPVYFAAVPLALCIPFDVDYRPDLHPLGKEAIAAVFEEARKGNYQVLCMVVYQRGAWFVVSDDYIKLFAALKGRPDYVRCVVMGKPESELLKDVEGPMSQEDALRALGLA
jgi:hypothetical protein